MVSEHVDAAVDGERNALVQMLVIVTIVLVPLPLGVVLWSTLDGAGDPNLRISASPFDIPLLLLLALVAPEMWRSHTHRLREGRWSARLATFTLSWFALAILVNPSWRALDLGFHTAGAAAVAYVLATRDRRVVISIVATVAAVAAVQGLIGIGQALTEDTLGLGPLEASTELWRVGGSYSGRGSFLHPYHLTTFLMLGLAACWLVRRLTGSPSAARASAACAAVIGLAIPLTFSRAAALALLVLVPIGLLGRERLLSVIVLVAVVCGSALGASGWEDRGETTADPSEIDSGRSDRLSEARAVFEDSPVLGVGPGRYAIAVEERLEPRKLLPAHNVVAHTAVEAGAIGGLLAALAIVVLAGLSIAGGPLGMVVGASMVNFHLLDAFPHVYPNGIVLTGLWVGFIALAVRLRREPDSMASDLDAEALSSPPPTPA